MIPRYIFFVTLYCLIADWGMGQVRVGEWLNSTSTISPRNLEFYDGRVYMATGGGVLVYDPEDTSFATIATAEGLVYTDISFLTVQGDWMWLGGAPPRGIVQLVNLITGDVHFVDLGLDEIINIVATEEQGFAAFRQSQEVGIVELRWDGSSYSFMDIYYNFPLAVSEILDLDLWADSLFVTTNVGVLGNDYRRSNLKDPLTWQQVVQEESDVFQYHVDSTGHYYLTSNALFHRAMDGWQTYSSFGGGTLHHLMRRSNGDFLVSISRLLMGIRPNGARYSSPALEAQVIAYTDGKDISEGYAALFDHGLAKYNYSSRKWTLLRPNTMAGQTYSSILKLRTGELVAAGTRGIARFNGLSWYNLLPSYNIAEGPEGDRIDDDARVQSSTFFLADTIYFRGKQSWNMLQRPSGDILIGFKGNPPRAGGILRLNFDDVAGYIKYDTTDGRLDGLARDAFITVRHMAMDRNGNVWIANPFSQIRQNVIAVLTRDDTWHHFSISDSRNVLNALPTEIAFDNWGRVWIGSQVFGELGSLGGIAVLDHGNTLGNTSDDQWTSVSARLESDHSNTVWSLTFDHNDVLWTISPDGVMGYYVQPNLSLTPFTQFGPYLRDIPFGEGSKIRVDAQNNKWITTPQYGIWVLLDNTTFWPTVDGFNTDNSSLISDEVLDIYLDDEDGVAYLATSKGISALKMPFKNNLADYGEMVIFPSPYRIPSDQSLIVDGLRQGSAVKIFTVTGRLVRELTAQNGGIQGYQAAWDGKNSSGDWVGSGVYLIAAYLPSGRSGVGKVAVIRR
ncbi:MAG: hypothetical protein JSW54_11965 [Fidelibacterota bacterium]|nr:MAG: hypothetical protein JSW54_11965 [Candidatus Neomarinimicrobiota bacterium]